MTITYTGSVANARLFGFSRLLFYWRGSIYKLMYKEMVIFCSIYTVLSLTYRLALNEPQKRLFERVALYCDGFSNLIPLSFVLGFYVAVCVGRWWNQYMSIPWPDRVMTYVTTMIDGADERAKIIRRTIMRYLSLSSIIVFQATSVVVKKRFPTMDHLIDAGLITEGEVAAMNEVQTPHGKWWVPCVWICNLIKAARKEGRIADTFLMKTLIDEVQTYRGNLGLLFSYDWISIPLVYTQVTTLAVYIFFLSCVLGRQFLDPKMNYRGHEVDLYFPAFTILQFFFYMGWLKVAEQLINPFGEDDDDFEINWVIDRNLQVSLIVADDMFDSYPQPEKDAYFDECAPDHLPYTKSTVDTITRPHMGSTADLSVSCEGMKIVTPMETIQENDATANHTGNHVHHANHVSHYPAYHHTPMSSPSNNRRLYPNAIIGCHAASDLHTPFNVSRNTLDSVKIDGPTKADAKLDGKLNTGNLYKHSKLGLSAGKLHCQLDGLMDHVESPTAQPTTQLATSVDTATLSPLVRVRRLATPVDIPAIMLQMEAKCDPQSFSTESIHSNQFTEQSDSLSGGPSDYMISSSAPDIKEVDDRSNCDIDEDKTPTTDQPPPPPPPPPPPSAVSPPDTSAGESRFDVCMVENDTYPQAAAETAPITQGLNTMIESERAQHSSDEYSTDYNDTNYSSVNSVTPLLKLSGRRVPSAKD